MGKLVDLTGQKFGRLTVLERAGSAPNKKATWRCHCDCGNETVVIGDSLKRGNTTSCGCVWKESLQGRAHNLTGQRFGRLKVISRVEDSQHNDGTRWLCICDCGNTTIVNSRRLTTGNTKSCGCLKSSVLIERNTTHGLHHTKLNKVWREMKNRTGNPAYRRWEDYGGRGIQTCDEWKNNFMVFYDWAMQHGYREGLAIDRINNDGNYEPGNCHWITIAENNKNRRQRYAKKPN